ncbi:manganese ABC transporter substrate binding component [Lactobacillus rhamnosus GG] [Lacticaseibacillus rhamnosus]|nr:manganese ABC transporter substrate binding component [Lactobacillus rhamnosus GG] [Lacticaseibacillus rhamnosus]
MTAQHLTTNTKEQDPHAWLDLANGIQYVKTITKVLKQKMPKTLLIILSLIHISEPTRPERISYAVFCLKKKKQQKKKKIKYKTHT